ncbi:hypothetical protein [Promineifilum sp.]|uniref:hypothetical protein n=1 Tax=Promineifilum sp. TaxID=2664178 RepID=UPI0035B1BA83
MEENSPEITSFVVRFIHSGPPENTAYRGSILNVQTNQEFAFVRWEEAVAFIRRFVGLSEAPGSGGAGEQGRRGA